ncbi:hypothetical protein [Streptomyces sp. MP131-18]|uniref:hypothetical protein n=1 Tax=Streptomyces sp. MP131-18 TaxID=1857892 RepID=UPI001180B556|nr:hypothetical protein [Streptomyces sp. MP131-18]
MAFLGIWAGALAFTGRERGRAAVITAALATQALLHVLFSFGQLRAEPPPTARSSSAQWMAERVLCPAEAHALSHSEALRVVHDAGLTSHLAHGHPPGSGGGPGASVAEAAHSLPGGTAGMIAAHLAVALLSAGWLWSGERAVFALLRWAVLRVLVPVPRSAPSPAPAPGGRAVPGPDGSRVLRQLLLVRRTGSRGPPAPAAALAAARRHGRVSPA